MKNQKQQTTSKKKIVKGENKVKTPTYGCLPYYPN